MLQGTIVRFTNILEDGDEDVRFEVLEDRGDRILVREYREVWLGLIIPTFLYPSHELTPA